MIPRTFQYYQPTTTLPPTCMIPAPFGMYDILVPEVCLPLKDLRFHAEVKDCISSVEILQHFVNTGKTAIECEYSFPIDNKTTAVTSLTVTIGDQVIEGKITEKEKAEEKYSDAIARGRTAIKMDQDENQPDIIKILVGNLLPQQEAIIVVKYVKQLEIEDKSWSFRIPVNYIPRTKPIQLFDNPATSKLAYNWSASVLIDSSKGITKIVSPSHKIDIEFKDGNKKVLVNLFDQTEVLDTDLIILFKTENPDTPSVRLQKLPEDDYYATLVSFYPTFNQSTSINKDSVNETEVNGSGEFIFLLDCSGSMSGTNIRIAKEALAMFLRSLPVDSKFNIVRFGSSHEMFKLASVKYDPSTLKEALAYVEKINANLGGTYLVGPLNAAMKTAYDPSYPRSIFLLTDGEVSDSQDVMKLIKANLYSTRVHSFGIGSDAGRELVKGAAIAGHGSFQFAKSGEDLTPKVVKSLAMASVPACTNAKLIWPSDIEIKLQSPPNGKICNVYMDEPFVVLALIKGSLQGKAIQLQFEETAHHKIIKQEAKFPDQPSEGAEIYQATAKNAIELNTDLVDQEIISLSTKYSVLSPLTSFIATKKNKGVAKEPMETIKIPISIGKIASPFPIAPAPLPMTSSLFFAVPQVTASADPFGLPPTFGMPFNTTFGSAHNLGMGMGMSNPMPMGMSNPMPQVFCAGPLKSGGLFGSNLGRRTNQAQFINYCMTNDPVPSVPQPSQVPQAKFDSLFAPYSSPQPPSMSIPRPIGRKVPDPPSMPMPAPSASKSVDLLEFDGGYCAPPPLAASQPPPRAEANSLFDFMDNSSNLSSSKSAPALKPLGEIIDQQEMYGNWNWNKATLNSINVDEQKATSNIPIALKGKISDQNTLMSVWITILALTVLQLKYADSKPSWQLIFKKAVQWLNKLGVSFTEFKELASKLIA